MKRKHRPRNRVHTFMRWPSEPLKRLKMAQEDIDFVIAIERCGIDCLNNASLLRMATDATERAMAAEQDLER